MMYFNFFLSFLEIKEKKLFISSFIVVVFSAYFTQIPFRIIPDSLRRREEVWKMLVLNYVPKHFHKLSYAYIFFEYSRCNCCDNN